MKKRYHINKSKLALVFLSCLTLSHSSSVFGQIRCERVHRPIEKLGISAGASFLHQKNPSLHTSHAIQNQAVHFKNKTGRTLKKPPEKIQAWLNYLEQNYKKYQDKPRAIGHIKKFFYEQFVTKFEEVPESFYDLQVRIAREQGRGNITLSKEQRKHLSNIAIQDQKKSLDVWIEYFFSKDSEMYPMWTKYWSLMAIVKMGKFDSEAGTFSHRSKGQMSPFPELNREALSLVIDSLVKKVEGKSLDDIKDPDLLSLLDGASFSKLYGRVLLLTAQSKQNLNSVQGKWITYPRGSDPTLLVSSLKGMNTGWCTAGEFTAWEHLAKGDFHVFYSNDEHRKPTIPRIAIRMESNSIAEIRGVGKDQHLDSQMAGTTVLERKLGEFGSDGKSYLKKTAHMKRLTEIELKHQQEKELSAEEIRFLYEVDEPIVGMGYGRDPRVDEILKQRSPRQDVSKALNIKESEVSLSQEEALKGGIKFHLGDIELPEIKSAEGLKLPQIIRGRLYIPWLKSADGLVLPKFVGGDLFLSSLQSVEGLEFPQIVGGKLDLSGLQSAKNLAFPHSVGGVIELHSLRSAEDVILPQSFDGDLELRNLQSAKGVKFPQSVQKNLYLNSLRTGKDLILPQSVAGGLHLGSLQSAAGLVLPQSVGGELFLRSLQSTVGLKLPQVIGGKVDLRFLQSTEGLTFPQTVGGDIDLFSLRSAKGLILPQSVGGNLHLNSLLSAAGVKFPQTVRGLLALQSLESMEGLKLPETVEGALYINEKFVH